MERSDVIVIGEGVIGLAAAWQLALRGKAVICIGDGQPRATDAAAGMLAPSFEAFHPRAARPLKPLLDEALEKWAPFVSALSDNPQQELGYQRDGIVAIGFARSPEVSAIPCPPPSAFPVSKAWCVPGEGQVDPRLLREVLHRAFQSAGGIFVDGEVTHIDLQPENINVGLKENQLRAEQVVLAGGVKSSTLLPGAEEMEAVRGRAFLQYAPELKLQSVVRTPMVYFCPKQDGHIYIGATEETPAGEAAALNGLWWEAVSICPALMKTQRVASFDGMRPATGNGLPKIGHWPEDERVFLAFGHDRNGVLLTPLTAERVVSAIIG